MEYGRQSARLPKSPAEREQWRRCIVILEHCPLEQVQSQNGWELLSDRHKRTLGERGLDPAAFRPDVVHQTMLHLLDSPLNRAGALQLFLRTHKNVLIAVDPRLRVPRSYRLFSKMMAMLLYRLRIKPASAQSSRQMLMKVVANPISDHLPADTKLIRVEKDGDLIEPFAFCRDLCSDACRHMQRPTFGIGAATATRRRRTKRERDAELAAAGDTDDDAGNADAPVWERAEEASRRAAASGSSAARSFHPFAFVIGGMARGDVSEEYGTGSKSVQSVRLSNRGMAAAAAASLLCHAVEEAWLQDTMI